MKGIILAGGAGTRLHPVTKAISKQLLPIYDKPMIYYPLSVLMLAGIREILLITTPKDLPFFQDLLGDGSRWGVLLSYEIQERPEGIPQAFLIGESFIAGDPVCLILGDNLFFGTGFTHMLMESSRLTKGAMVYAYSVRDPERFGVVELDTDGRPLSLEEKSKRPASNWAVTGLYFYDKQVVDLAKSLQPSLRGELEITDLNRLYLEAGELSVMTLGRGFAWLDTGTHESLLEASEFIATIQKRQGYMVACLEEIAFNNQWITKKHVISIAQTLLTTDYGKYLTDLVEQ